ncbi:MAG: hypothetical protein BWX96_02047 [Bacteroidetes bacterium ADurb.Bin145]|jgi:hypothetical protein|nr:MAG: hypothetical protein BWX96_02047 [Bacteroidetes bacterium ADurb.Bin145]
MIIIIKILKNIPLTPLKGGIENQPLKDVSQTPLKGEIRNIKL